MKKALKLCLIAIICIAVAAVALFTWLTLTEFKPAQIEEVTVEGTAEKVSPENEIRILSWNAGYAGLGKDADFFMDGGESVRSADRDTVEKNIAAISAFVSESDADITILQELDKDSTRSYGVDQTEYFDGVKAYAMNYSCNFVPYPLPPIGRVNSGVMTVSEYEIESAERVSLFCPFEWPVRVANLKRCLLVSYMPIEGSDKQLVIVNTHLEAYDSGEGKALQTKQLREFIAAEYEKGNYVITGGDFNQSFPNAIGAYPNAHSDLWAPGLLDNDSLPEGFSFACDLTSPTCRLLNQPYNPEDSANTQYYVIDGYIVSPNVEVKSVETVDLGFENSDHNPVILTIELK